MRTLLFAAWLTCAAACAKGPPPAAPKPASDFDLNDTRWWLREQDGRKDGRIIEFKKQGDEYIATVVNPGRILGTMRYEKGMVYAQVKKSAPSTYQGTYLQIFLDGTKKRPGVTFQVRKGWLHWSVSGTDRWERLP